jgi:hypothetical protein
VLNDPMAILFAIILLALLLVVGSRFLPDELHLDPWRYHAPPDRPGGQEDDDASYHWDRGEASTPPDRDR